MNEAERKRRLVAEINKIDGAYAIRNEDRFALGRLDMVIKLPGAEILFVEGKLILGNIFAPSQRQYIEGLRLLQAGLRPLLIGWKHDQLYISEWVEVADYRHCFTAQNRSSAGVLQEYLTKGNSSNGQVASIHLPGKPG